MYLRFFPPFRHGDSSTEKNLKYIDLYKQNVSQRKRNKLTHKTVGVFQGKIKTELNPIAIEQSPVLFVI